MKVVTEGIREEKDGSLSSGSHQTAFFSLFPSTVLLSLPRLLAGCSAVFLVCISRARETPRHAFLYIIVVSAPRLTLATVWVIWTLYRGSVSAALEGCEGGSADFLPIKLNRKQQSHRQLLLPPPSLSSETRKHINHTSPTALCSPVSRYLLWCGMIGTLEGDRGQEGIAIKAMLYFGLIKMQLFPLHNYHTYKKKKKKLKRNPWKIINMTADTFFSLKRRACPVYRERNDGRGGQAAPSLSSWGL